MQNDSPRHYVKTFCSPEIKAVNVEKQEVVAVISAISTDRAGDVVEPGGARIDNFMKNPVVLADHNYSIFSIIGRAEKLEIEKDKIVSRVKFDDGGAGKEAFRLVKNGMARAWSIGFKPIEHETIKDDEKRIRGFRFKVWELLEHSLVAIPMHPEALNLAIQRGKVSEDYAHVFFREPAGPSVPAPKATPAPANDARAMLLDEAATAFRKARLAKGLHV